MLIPFREADDKRNLETRIQQCPFVTGHPRAVIGIEENDRAIRQSIVFQLLKNGSDLLVHDSDTVIKPSNRFPDNRSVWIVWRNRRRLRAVNFTRLKLALNFRNELLIGPNHRPALMGGH